MKKIIIYQRKKIGVRALFIRDNLLGTIHEDETGGYKNSASADKLCSGKIFRCLYG